MLKSSLIRLHWIQMLKHIIRNQTAYKLKKQWTKQYHLTPRPLWKSDHERIQNFSSTSGNIFLTISHLGIVWGYRKRYKNISIVYLRLSHTAHRLQQCSSFVKQVLSTPSQWLWACVPYTLLWIHFLLRCFLYLTHMIQVLVFLSSFHVFWFFTFLEDSFLILWFFIFSHKRMWKEEWGYRMWV